MIAVNLRRCFYGALLAFLLTCFSTGTLAWNSGGHRLIALIAWERLNPQAKDVVLELLRQHPDFGRWQARSKPAYPALAAFLEAATWPDDIRKDPRFYTAGSDDPTPAEPGFPDMERRQHWHYVNRPINPDFSDEVIAGELGRRLPELILIVGDTTASLQARAYALPWLIHLVGDAHQPLHAATRLSPNGESDRGGNLTEVYTSLDSGSQPFSLHRYWDELPAPSWLRLGRLEAVARALVQNFRETVESGEVSQWLDESWQLAKDHAYPPEDDATFSLSAEYHASARAIANRRVTEAGYRLADLLNRLLGQ